MPEGVNGGRVTTREFYSELQGMRKENMDERELMRNKVHDVEKNLMAHITDELKPLSKYCKQVDVNEKEVDKLRTRSDRTDGILGLLTVLGAGIGSLFGPR